MKNLLNCHCVGLHSFPISESKEGYLKRIFYADTNHELWKPYTIAIHPHHIDIKITVLDGTLTNIIYKFDKYGNRFYQYSWESHILNGNGGFKCIGSKRLAVHSWHNYSKGQSVELNNCELHTVRIKKEEKCVWLIEESKPSSEYIPINYSPNDLERWTPEGLYIECDEETKQNYIKDYLHLIK